MVAFRCRSLYRDRKGFSLLPETDFSQGDGASVIGAGCRFTAPATPRGGRRHWCGPCRMMNRSLENIHGVDVLKVNVDNFPQVAQRYGIMSIPTLILFENGNALKSSVGIMTDEMLIDFIK